MKFNKKLIWFFIFFLVILAFILSLNQFNRQQIKKKFSQITLAEGVTIGHLLEVSGYHLAEQGENELTGFLDRLYGNPTIVYIGLFQEDELKYLLSRFDGFFPVVLDQEEQRILDTPIGRIFEVSSQFKEPGGTTYRLYIGFDYEFLTTFEDTMSRNMLTVVGLFAFIVLLVMLLVYYFDKKFYKKELELVQEKQEKERFKELSLLTAEIAHEIKNPLNSIYLSFNTLENFLDKNDEAHFYREAIKDEIRRISGILQSYAELSREIRPNWSQLDITTFADTFKFLVRKQADNHGASLTIQIEGGRYIRTDEDILKQILINLFNNSLEAGSKNIHVQLTVKQGALTLTVKDDGKGIDSHMKELVFKPYVSGKTKGMGLGLHITQRLVEALGGDIRLISGDHGGTCFEMVLPPGKKKGKMDIALTR